MCRGSTPRVHPFLTKAGVRVIHDGNFLSVPVQFRLLTHCLQFANCEHTSGKVAECIIAAVLKTVDPKGPWVGIPLFPLIMQHF